MSLSQMQVALALLIRHPDDNRGDKTERFLAGFELDAFEREQLGALAADPRVAKYGHSMAGTRLESAERKLRLSRKFLPEEFFSYLWMRYFEPRATKIPLNEIVGEFLDFALSDEEVRGELESNAPPFIFDLLRFERAQHRFRLGQQWQPPHSASLLLHRSFVVERFEYDIPAFIASEADEAGPEPRKLLVLFLGKRTEPGCRYFEIDEAVASFLEAERSGDARRELPPSYSDLVGIGLCRETKNIDVNTEVTP